MIYLYIVIQILISEIFRYKNLSKYTIYSDLLFSILIILSLIFQYFDPFLELNKNILYFITPLMILNIKNEFDKDKSISHSYVKWYIYLSIFIGLLAYETLTIYFMLLSVLLEVISRSINNLGLIKSQLYICAILIMLIPLCSHLLLSEYFTIYLSVIFLSLIFIETLKFTQFRFVCLLSLSTIILENYTFFPYVLTNTVLFAYLIFILLERIGKVDYTKLRELRLFSLAMVYQQKKEKVYDNYKTTPSYGKIDTIKFQWDKHTFKNDLNINVKYILFVFVLISFYIMFKGF